MPGYGGNRNENKDRDNFTQYRFPETRIPFPCVPDTKRSRSHIPDVRICIFKCHSFAPILASLMLKIPTALRSIFPIRSRHWLPFSAIPSQVSVSPSTGSRRAQYDAPEGDFPILCTRRRLTFPHISRHWLPLSAIPPGEHVATITSPLASVPRMHNVQLNADTPKNTWRPLRVHLHPFRGCTMSNSPAPIAISWKELGFKGDYFLMVACCPT